MASPQHDLKNAVRYHIEQEWVCITRGCPRGIHVSRRSKAFEGHTSRPPAMGQAALVDSRNPPPLQHPTCPRRFLARPMAGGRDQTAPTAEPPQQNWAIAPPWPPPPPCRLPRTALWKPLRAGRLLGLRAFEGAFEAHLSGGVGGAHCGAHSVVVDGGEHGGRQHNLAGGGGGEEAPG